MSEQTASSFSRWMTLARVIAVSVPVIGAMPTATNIYYGWQHDIPWWDVPHRAEQARLWEKNAECRLTYRTLTAGNDTVVGIGACPGTGDISLKISAANRDPVYQWIPFRSLRKPGEKSSFWDYLIPAAHAAPQAEPKSQTHFKLAQATSQVVCQSRQGKSIVRIVKEGARCFREVFSPFKGRVEDRKEVPCDTKCP